MSSSLFPTVSHPNPREPKYTFNPIANLAKAITDVVLLPFKMITFIFLAPILLPLILLHSIIVISVNAFVLFAFISVSTLFICALTASEIAFPIGLLGVGLISLIGLSAIQRSSEEFIKSIFDVFSF
ncbi:MAG: hypothetical protein K940chlam1_00321 [Candidatus Anoxychlamydiales bacterium]|nr:hypothetical protein [Candidatus Anoxychlamydiales bacterium]NGX35935.1 hypothetical protein [Candidatus Anoxychlamydiales bacterium]